MEITEAGYENIRNKAGYTLQNNGEILPYLNIINFGDGFNITQDDVGTNISLTTGTSNIISLYWDGTDVSGLNTLATLYSNRANVPIILNAKHGDDIVTYVIDSSLEDINQPTQVITLTPDLDKINITNSSVSNIKNINTIKYSLVLTCSYNSGVISITNAEFVDITLVLGSYPDQEYINNQIDSKISKTWKGTFDARGISGLTTHVINHNLNTANLLIQFRDMNTKKEVFLDNEITDDNNVTIYYDQDINIQIFIIALN